MGRSPKAPSLVDMFIKNTMLLDVLMATIVTNVVMMVGWTGVAGRSVTRTCVTAMGVQDRPDLSEDTTARQAGHSIFKIVNTMEMGMLPLTDNKYRFEVANLNLKRRRGASFCWYSTWPRVVMLKRSDYLTFSLH